jgi:subtilase family serine protease
MLVALLALPMATTLSVSAASSPSLASPSLHGFKTLGPAPGDLPVLATFALPLRNVAALDTLVMQVSDPSSPEYRHFLTPAQAQDEFLPVAGYDSLLAYLHGMGFQVVFTALDSEIVVEATVGQLQSAFGAHVDTFTNGTLNYYATTGAPSFDGAYLYASNATLLYMKPAVVTSGSYDSNVTFTASTFSAMQLQPVYNATYFYSQGERGSGETIGLLDFYGSPTISEDLAQFDRTYGFPNTTLNIIPIGPYDPSLGANVGWSTEIALDVEASHAMAPGATIDLYAANGALPLSAILAQIVQDDKVTTLSQSFGVYEWYYSLSSQLGGPGFVALNSVIPDQYYALGSAEGISFTASSGDGGGSGYSSGPEGSLEYPAASPFVTSVGGTQTYFSSGSKPGSVDFRQTAWSNIGYVPNLVNAGGGGGGVSILEPKPWYQSSQNTPPSYPDGRLNPDLALQAGVDPSMAIVSSGQVVGTGGTSESSPLLAGLLTLVAESDKGHLGLINPFLYKVGNDAAEYQRGYTPISFGYIIPWRASFGYNLATGWGSPNMGELALLLNSTQSQKQLKIAGDLVNGTGMGQIDYTPGQNLTVNAKITESGKPVDAGSFSFTLETLQGATAATPLTFRQETGNWTGTFYIGQQAGFTDLLVNGSSADGTAGEAFGTVFTGYLGSLTVTNSAYSLSFDPWSWTSAAPLDLTVSTTDLNGSPAPAGTYSLDVMTYSISTNQYTTSNIVKLNGTGSGTVKGSLAKPVSPGPVSLIMQGDVYGYAETVYGIYLQASYIYPDVAAEPGSVAPGQSLTIIATPIPPVNVYFETSLETGRLFAYDVSVGSNVTATLVSPSGVNVSTATLAYQSCAQALKVCNGGADVIYGQLPVPSGTPSGLYTVMLHASYGSLTAGGNITGNFYGQIWVSKQDIRPVISILPGLGHLSPDFTIGQPPADQGGELFQGEPAHIVANIDYGNGSAVTYGEYTAIVYPASLSGEYTSLMHQEYAGGGLVRLSYDPGLEAWVGNVTLPSPANQGGLNGLGINSFEYSGPYDVYVTGLSFDGTPTASDLSAQQPFEIQPYVYLSGNVGSVPQGAHLAFVNANITASGDLSGDLFIDSSVTNAHLNITDSQVRGSFGLSSANVTLTGVAGGNFNVRGSTLALVDSSIDKLTVTGGRVTMQDSSYESIVPALPTITVTGLSSTVSDNANFTISIMGLQVATGSLAATVDGNPISLNVASSSTGVVATGTINGTSLPDGVHTLLVKVAQSDGLSKTSAIQFATNAQAISVTNQVNTLSNGVALWTNLSYGLAVVAIVAIVFAIWALMRKPATVATTKP